MPIFKNVKWIIILTVIVMLMNSCVSSQKKSTNKGTSGENALTPLTAFAEEKAPVLDIPSYYENIVFSDVTGFNEYIIGPGDLLTVTEWKTTGASVHKLPVRPNGKVSFSFFEDIKVAGLTPTQIDDLITSQLEGYVKKPRIDVVVTEYRSKKVSFFGEINRVEGALQSGPGIYPLKGKIKLSEFLLEAGSETSKADLKNVELIRRGKLYKLNLLDAMTLKDLSQDVLVENGDKITIPLLPQFRKEKEAVQRAYVFGMVPKAGWKEFTGKVTIAEILGKTMGFNIQGANLSKIKVIRGTPENPVFINVNFRRLLTKGDMSQNVPIRDRDIIYVPKTGLSQTVSITGQIGQILGVVLQYPARFREDYTTGGGLRLETDVSERSLAEENRLGGFSGASAQ
jgi:polysaccharide biosynthesis/export protein